MSTPDDHPPMSPVSAEVPGVREGADVPPIAIPIVGQDERGGRPAIEVLAGDVPSVASVIHAKIEAPPLRSTTLSRQRLLDALAVGIDRRVTLVVADAGYGKTTLLTDYASRAITRCLWYRLDSADQDWITLVNYIIAAAREAEPLFGERTLSMLTTDPTTIPPRDVILRSLMADLQGLAGTPTTLIIDDFHEIDEDEGACDVIARLIRDAPPSFNFILASRRRPALLLARLAGQGELVEVGMDELRFSRDEIDRLFAERYGRQLDPDVLVDLDLRTKGWAATLQLFGSSIRGRPVSDVRSLVRSMSGSDSPVYDFLAEEVLAHLEPPLQEFVVRAALLAEIMPDYVVALFAETDQPTERQAGQWIEDVDAFGIASRSSQSSESRCFHPLLQEFLLRQLAQRSTDSQIKEMHRRVARVAALKDPLVAAHHYIEADDKPEAMRCLASSVLLTLGSGRWGTASELVDRLSGVPADPVVSAIRARRLLDEGEFDTAAAILDGIDVTNEPPATRAIMRQTRLSLAWRQGDSETLFSTLREIENDAETPPLLLEIAQIFVDSSPLSPNPATLTALSNRLQRMAEHQASTGHTYYAAISLHNAAIALLNSGKLKEAIRVGLEALTAFERLAFPAPERFSTHHVLALALLELGNREEAEDHIRIALSTGTEEGDVHSSCANSLAIIGEPERSSRLLLGAEALERRGRSDLQGVNLALLTRAFLQLTTNTQGALAILRSISVDSPLDLGWNVDVYVLKAMAGVLGQDQAAALSATRDGLSFARRRGCLRAEVRLDLLAALATDDSTALRSSLTRAASIGELAILEVADALGHRLELTPVVPAEITDSIVKWPGRWLPVLRRQLQRGNYPSAHVAAALLDQYGSRDDVALLRAFEKTYVKRGRAIGLGRRLAKRVSDRLIVQDLGRVDLQVGERRVALSGMRRKPASLLMYLATRPNLTAAKEQVLDDLWQEADPEGALNSLNQSLYFLRRDIDPWYEDDISADYVCYEGELVWLDPELVHVASAAFVSDARALGSEVAADRVLQVMSRYRGQFSPEFEYEEWAISWRLRVHATFLDLAHHTLTRLIAQGDLRGAREVGLAAISVDPMATDIERILVWLFARLGATSAAHAQYQHVAAVERSDGLDPPTFEELVSRSPLD